MNYSAEQYEYGQVMVPVEIKNQDVLDALNECLWFFKNPKIIDNHQLNCEDQKIEDWCSEEYMNRIIAQGTKHDGYPERCKSYNLAPNRLRPRHGNPNNADILEGIDKFNECNEGLINTLMTRNNALFVMYPPDGFISWHNNQNAPGYNLIFTYSETGDGCFKYYDANTGKVVTIQDKPGQWTCKGGYFGAFHEPFERKVYHAAHTNSWRMTVSYIFTRGEMGMNIHQEIIEEISTPL